MSDTNEAKLADFDLDAWIDGTTGITGVARLIQRGDLLARLDELERELEIVKRIPDDDRGVVDRTREQVEADIEAVYEQLHDSMLLLHIQDRTEGRRRAVRDRLKAKKVTDVDTVNLHILADAIVKVETPDGRAVPLPPDGFPPEKLREIRDRLGDSALLDAWRVFGEVTSQAPAVRAPLSRARSLRTAGTMSRSRYGRRASGASRR